ncbi:unknown protein [Microcystis aeruginosa NIES-843]|uniref:Uncharacterized protein n=1 Tax=Microcystis aeruginosa (strain NIES-843 / IAM M-2473) TaxID=449447 RepID=B0JLT8_MICAN|nr:unknown protein [Microcystis aeruginosa NIES-843]
MPLAFCLVSTSNLNYEQLSSFHQNQAWARGLNHLLAKLVDTSVTGKVLYLVSP